MQQMLQALVAYLEVTGMSWWCVQVKPEMLSVLQLGPAIMAPSRTNGFLNMLETALHVSVLGI